MKEEIKKCLSKIKGHKEEKRIIRKLLDNDKIFCEIGYRGGYIGCYSFDLLKMLGCEEYAMYMPKKFGAFMNYLGGGIRGDIRQSDFDDELYDVKYKDKYLGDILYNLGKIFCEIYLYLDNKYLINDSMEGLVRV